MALAILLLAMVPAARTQVSPVLFTRVEGPTASSAGIGEALAPARLLQVHEDLPARAIQAVAFRRDGQLPVDLPSFSVVLSVFMSTAATTAATPDPVFDRNHGTDRRSVASNQFVQLPAVAYGGFAHPFEYRIPLALYQHSAAGPLCLELQVASRSGMAIWLDAASGADPNPGGVVRELGVGCRVAMTAPPATLGGWFLPNWPARTMTLGFSGSGLPANRVAALTLGDSASTWGGLPLPFELPGTATAPSGPCTVFNSVVLTVPQLTDAMGNLTSSVGFGVNPSIRGRNVYFQLVVPEPAANGWGLVLTNGVQFHPWAPWTLVPVGSVELAGSGSTGMAVPHHGQVIRFE